MESHCWEVFVVNFSAVDFLFIDYIEAGEVVRHFESFYGICNR
jgi:hypothetical protein